VKEEATPGGDPEAEALLARMGVEEEGVESGQLLGLVAATIAAIIALAVILIYLFYIPYRTQVGAEAEGLARSTDLDIVRTEGLAKLEQYARTDETYALPIDRAMAVVAAQYGTSEAPAAGLPRTRGQWNTVSVTRGPGRAVQVPTQRGALTAPVPETGIDAGPLDPSGVQGGRQEALRRSDPLVGQTGEEIGVDEPELDDN
jgi:uncharacterized membrane protein